MQTHGAGRASGPPGPVLRAEGISKRFGGVVALDGVSFDVRPGEVHTLAGENGSGKSTLIKIVAGVETPDAGTIEVAGDRHAHLSPRHAIALGIQVIFQDFSLFPNLSVAENIAVSTYIGQRRRTIRPARLRRIAAEVVSRIGVRLELDTPVEELSVADRQLTAICRALAQEARIIFMDEPTTALTRREVQALFRVVEQLREHGVALVFVSHKLEEVLQLSERITVLRNGAVVVSGDVSEFDRSALTVAMTGRALTDTPPPDSLQEDASPLLEVQGLTSKGRFEDVSFSVRPGEILGVTGLLGSGRTEIAESLFGVVPADSGTITVEGRRVRIRSVEDAITAGIGYVPGDRLTQGVFLDQSIARNIVAGSIDRLTGPVDVLPPASAERVVERAAADIRIKMSSPEAPVRALSGGNQQRVVLAKWLVREPHVLILNSPTVGVDVGSKHEILDLLRAKAGEGIGIVVISDDVPELVAVCHRVLVVREGRIIDELAGDRLTEDEIVKELA
jgi:simple sugar transport system ATP-binding protein